MRQLAASLNATFGVDSFKAALAYTFGRDMRGNLVAKTMLPLGDVTHPRRELHIETSKGDRCVKCTAAVFERTEDGKGLVHSFAMSSYGKGDFRKTLGREPGRATEASIRRLHVAALNTHGDILNEARGFYVAQEVAHG